MAHNGLNDAPETSPNRDNEQRAPELSDTAIPIDVGTLIALSMRILDLCEVVGELARCEREKCEVSCVSCDANLIARDLRALLGGEPV